MKEYDVVIVGAGAAGVGASFDSWPEEMRFFTPSFPNNSAGLLDLNSIAIGTSSAYSLQVEHPTGRQYAQDLKAVAEHFELPVQAGIDVLSTTESFPGILLNTNQGQIHA